MLCPIACGIAVHACAVDDNNQNKVMVMIDRKNEKSGDNPEYERKETEDAVMHKWDKKVFDPARGDGVFFNFKMFIPFEVLDELGKENNHDPLGGALMQIMPKDMKRGFLASMLLDQMRKGQCMMPPGTNTKIIPKAALMQAMLDFAKEKSDDPEEQRKIADVLLKDWLMGKEEGKGEEKF